LPDKLATSRPISGPLNAAGLGDPAGGLFRAARRMPANRDDHGGTANVPLTIRGAEGSERLSLGGYAEKTLGDAQAKRGAVQVKAAPRPVGQKKV
jgi:hypothetical protein